ncbi:MAG: AAA family ATPase [Myxococcota bacterium]
MALGTPEGAGLHGAELVRDDESLCHLQFQRSGSERPYDRWYLNSDSQRLVQLGFAPGLTEAERVRVFNDHGPVDMRDLSSWRPDLLVFAPAESRTNDAMVVSDVPEATVDGALKLGDRLQPEHRISTDTVNEMWKVLVWHIKQRESDRQEFETRPENLEKTKKQLLGEFDTLHPDPLEALAGLWNRILAPAGLEFDRENARIPVQLTDNLQAYIRLKGTHERIPYGALSTGIRNFLFRVGHLFLLYFNRSIDSAFVFVDEPENSLFPDFLFDLMEVYDTLVGPNTQLFVATHSPIVAAQFAPHERLVLDWNGDASVSVHKGIAPKGDDPNDVLRQDFNLAEVMGPEGRRKWAEYVDLKARIRVEQDAGKRQSLLEQAALIGRAYRFET